MEILFRGKDVKTGEWVEGDLIHLPNNKMAIVKCGTFTVDSSIEVIPETVSQYRGKDNFKNNMFDGDIVLIAGEDINLYNDNGDDITLKEVIELGEEVEQSVIECGGIITGDFYDWNTWTIDFALDADYIFEVIGNKFDNPELLKGA